MITKDDIEITIECLEEHIPVRGNAIVSGDDEYDREVEDRILSDLEWNPWAWCCVKVTVSVKYPPCAHCGHVATDTESDYLGGCSYTDEKDFIAGGYYEDMIEEAFSRLQARSV